MIRSMTGFGRGKAENDQFRVQVDLRAVNHRFLDLRCRLPFFSPELEECLKRRLDRTLHRGKVDLLLTVEEKAGGGTRLRVNRPLLDEYLELLRTLRRELELEGQTSLDHVAALPWGKVFEVGELEVAPDDLPVFEEALEAALDQLVEMRAREGGALQRDFLEHIEGLEIVLGQIEEGAGDLLEATRDRLRERVRQLMQDREPDEDRLLQEAAFLADRCDISEEIARLRGRLEGLRETLGEEGSVGKKLDFLLQECHREVNTIGSKSKGADVSREVVQAKSHVEAMREQAQNVE